MRQHLKIRHNFMALNSVPLCNIKVACLGFFFKTKFFETQVECRLAFYTPLQKCINLGSKDIMEAQ